MDIGVLVDAVGNTASFEEGGTVQVYRRQGGEWSVTRSRAFQPSSSPAALRAGLYELAQWLGDCRVLTARSIKGIAFTILEGQLFSQWEMKGSPLEFLDYICEQEQIVREQQEEKKQQEKVAPVSMGRGKYFLDLRPVMDDAQSVYTSKQMLLPFLKEGQFKEVEVLCSHLPRWFEREFPALNLKAEAEQADGGLRVQISFNTL